MRPGFVASIRVNPLDCMSVIDILDAAQFDYSRLSYSAMVSMALATMVQTAKNLKMIPERSGYEYSEMMAPYLNQQRSREKLRAADNMVKARIEHSAPAIPDIFATSSEEKKTGEIDPLDSYRKLLRVLDDKEEHDPENFDDSDRARQSLFRKIISSN